MSDTMKWIIFGLVIILGIKILKDVGILDTKEDKQADALSTLSALDPKYYTTLKGKVNITTFARAKDLAKKLFDAKGYLYDTDEQAIGVIKQLKNKAQVSYVAKIFFNLYARDLGTYLEFMSEKNMASMNNFISKLPKQ